MTTTSVVSLIASEETSDVGWGKEQGRAPEPNDDEVIVMDEPGRAFTPTGPHLWGVCYRSHYFRVFALRADGDLPYPLKGPLILAVRHGAGTERLRLGSRAKAFIAAIQDLPSDVRYSALHTIYDLASKQARDARDVAYAQMTKAFLDGRLKKRVKGGITRVEVLLQTTTATA